MTQARYRPVHYVLKQPGQDYAAQVSFVRAPGDRDLRVALCGLSSCQTEILCTEHLDAVDCPRCIEVTRNIEDCHVRMGI